MARQVVEPPATGEQRLKMSYEEYLAWSDEDTHAEWVAGEVIVFMPPTIRHQEVLLFLAQLLAMFVRRFQLGKVIIAPAEMRLARSAREPDMLFVAQARLGHLTAQRLIGPADLVVEFVSDSSVARDRDEKYAEYEAEGVREYWMCDPRPGKERASFFQLGVDGKFQAIGLDREGRYHSAVLPGFWLMPAWLWEDPLPDPLALLEEIAPDAFGLSKGRTGEDQPE